MPIRIGDRIPAASFRYLDEGVVRTVSTDELTRGRRIVLFSVPGAFTQKSTQLQVPSYLQHADEIVAQGVDAVLCVSVNDAHVMHAWAQHCGVGDRIRMLADGHCAFFTAMGMELDCTRFELGYRCHRFSMIVDDGQVRTLNIEEPGAYEISGAETIVAQLRQLNAPGQPVP
jgi:glutaredoxin/glutathione-dependent peroxiredoxin